MYSILIIEDNQDIRENTQEILELTGYNVSVAEDGREGVEKAFSILPDIILCDIMMPRLDGYGVRELLLENDLTKDIPFIFLTAKTDLSDIRKGMNMGADDYLTKPFDDVDLMKSIRLRLEKKEKSNVSKPKSKMDISELIEGLTEGRKQLTYVKKENIYREQEYASSAYLVIKGTVKAFRINEDGKELIYQIYKKGDVFGLCDILLGENHAESTACLEDSSIIKISKIDFQKSLDEHSISVDSVVKHLTSILKTFDDKLISMAYDSVRMRVASNLVTLHKVYKRQSDNSIFKIQREDLAAMVGTSPESVIRTLSDFKKEGLISIAKNEITIEDIEGLEHFRF